ncbi:Alpha/Beta hydrolase protein [Aspergillus alliaceus]|uniref:Alpha/Beta hydrolase protein n=1 Tax=Petromyces alliaceus TaxID=209559 RepID=UPI0012A4A25B|nr:Alpha/Beta hydrolase protein [Aspergillus alliaceus]KAB8228467.1 Alpha/Beta hydrolase protein [Aspergillus alliaceus]
MGFLFTALTLFLAAYLRISIASSLLVVDLGYELHQVFSLNQTTELYNFSNIRYAAPPLGGLRFRAPLPPKLNRSEVQTGSVGRVCPQATPIWSRYIMPLASLDVSTYPFALPEDPRISEDCLFLDVVVPQKVFDRAQSKIPERNPNAALHDQRLGLIWVTQNIHLFGGQSDWVTVMGVSAGSGSILHQITAYKGLQGPSLFQQAILQSPAWEPKYDTDKEERTFRQYLKLLNVSSIEDARQISSEKLIAANAYQVSSSLYGTFTYGPVVDGIFVLDLPALMYTPPSSLQDSGLSSLVDGHFPGISESMKGVILNVYPPILDRNHGYSSWLERDSLALSDICFQCKSYDLNHAHKDNSYSCVFSIPPAMHWLDHPYTFYIKGEKPIAENPIFQVVNETVAYILQDYFTSFAQTGKLTSPLGPALEIYGSESRVLSLGLNNITVMRDPACDARCVYWQSAFYFDREGV